MFGLRRVTAADVCGGGGENVLSRNERDLGIGQKQEILKDLPQMNQFLQPSISKNFHSFSEQNPQLETPDP